MRFIQGCLILFSYFFEKSLNLLKDEGLFSFICSNKFAQAKYGHSIKKFNFEI